ncbi:MAG: glycoside hydrolase family 2 [Alteromonadaceae bacterium]|nr:glycoside hydrolase family 2 [Alteromonadaceae bacterium]MBB19079.1 glycoside hydrolase family 2 [Rickettsiales bacterium]
MDFVVTGRIKIFLITLVSLFILGCAPPQSSSNQSVPVDHKALSIAMNKHSQDHQRLERDFNRDWLFSLSDNTQFSNTNFDDSAWRTLNLPHDWSVELAFDKQKGDGATGYLPGGIGWYRKHFTTPSNSSELPKAQQRHFIYFDGVYNRSDVYLNGQKLGAQEYGYTPFYYDVTSVLAPEGEDNVIAVRVNHSRYIDSRWYTGSGIYRNVEFITTGALHIPIWGSYVLTPSITDSNAHVVLATKIANAQAQSAQFTVQSYIENAQQQVVAKHEQVHQLAANSTLTANQEMNIARPIRWDINNPYQYTVVSRILQNDRVIDEYRTPFGIRELRFDANKGFFLNGRSLKIKGVNLHHDAGLVGSAVPDDVWRRRLLKLKEAGVNAIRVAHNPSSKAFLDLCDELGLMVQVEIFDEWDNPKDKRLNQQERHSDDISRGYADIFARDAKQDLTAAVTRDRNHPLVIMWSIGNEIEWTYPRYAAATGYFDMNAGGNYFFNPPFITTEEINHRFHQSPEGEHVLAKTAKKLSDWVKALDTSRPVTANLILPSVSHISGYADALDVIGYSYRRVIYDYGHERYPDKMIMGTENVPQWHEWKAVMERDFIGGTFLWTGIDYLGEAHNQWPKKSSATGLLDLAGFEKPAYHMFKTLWNDTPHLYLTTQTMPLSPYKLNDNGDVVEKKKDAWQQYVWGWHDVNHHWNYNKDTIVAIEVYTNCASAELMVNGQSKGIKNLADFSDRILKWAVPYTSGTVVAKGLGDCKTQDQLQTAENASQINLHVDRQVLPADGYGVAHIELQMQDNQGKPVVLDEQTIQFEITGPVTVLGVDNGAPDSLQPYQAQQVTTAKGRALLLLQSTLTPGEVTVTASGSGVKAASLHLTIK